MTESNTQETKSKGLNQDDFRKLLQTPRPGDASSKGILGIATPRQRIPQTPKIGGSGSFAKPEIPSSKIKKSTRFRKLETSDAETADNKYRDRAAERRKGANPDYQETEQILKALNSETLEAKLIYEQSKYLGGDTEHTHLVKEESQETLKINSRLARNIYEIAIVEAKKKPPKENELFVAGRMAYVFELDDDKDNRSDAFAIPTTIIRSKADINNPTGTDKSTNDLVIEKISRVMAYVRKSASTENKGKRVKKKLKEKQPEEILKEKVAAIDESEDIFADAGRDYHIVMKEEKQDKREEDNINSQSQLNEESSVSKETDSIERNYFGASSQEEGENDSMDIDKIQETQQLKTLMQQAVTDNTEKVKEENQKNINISNENTKLSKGIKRKLYGQDSYDGNYSMYGMEEDTRENAYESGHSDSDSDNIMGIEHTIRDQGVTKNKKAQLSRWDFDTEEEWQAYKNNVTAMPKSAFQFGVKTGDGRRTRRSGKELTEKQKLDRDFQKISKIIERKYGKEENESTPKKKQKK
ncbi:8042_t:CDS:2 [Diversispora eburnea]|uniref:8042_t:CDS:1 n=1 Tax=Diversispora eburnea TaxID=1213867 RepID=A0A9N8Z0U0_9GLOM|nr:8042_t:CDS:2 [Diversispora eburnea]